MRGSRNDSRYEQFEVSPETIEQEFRPVVCEQQQTDLRILIGRKEGDLYFGKYTYTR